MQKLPALKRVTNMLICGEDLGLVPACVPEVMRDLGFLGLEIQRMPKTPGREFSRPADAPYLSVVTPSTHDMNTIRGWWLEDRALTQKFFNRELGLPGEAPLEGEPEIVEAVVRQHLASPAMWSIFQLQDLLGMDGALAPRRRGGRADQRAGHPEFLLALPAAPDAGKIAAGGNIQFASGAVASRERALSFKRKSPASAGLENILKDLLSPAEDAQRHQAGQSEQCQSGRLGNNHGKIFTGSVGEVKRRPHLARKVHHRPTLPVPTGKPGRNWFER